MSGLVQGNRDCPFSSPTVLWIVSTYEKKVEKKNVGNYHKRIEFLPQSLITRLPQLKNRDCPFSSPTVLWIVSTYEKKVEKKNVGNYHKRVKFLPQSLIKILSCSPKLTMIWDSFIKVTTLFKFASSQQDLTGHKKWSFPLQISSVNVQ